ncbi:hypothetical protein G6F59_018797 [Rhizopus arrhizus]|nr:hypothetical protein G6F59_018797 [Rhizopus arrhizus]
MGISAEPHPLHARVRSRASDDDRGHGRVRFWRGRLARDRGGRGIPDGHRPAAVDGAGGRALDRSGHLAQPQLVARRGSAGADLENVPGGASALGR